MSRFNAEFQVNLLFQEYLIFPITALPDRLSDSGDNSQPIVHLLLL
jgi:hypothetical protein